jgi:hypothetical protein
VVRRRGTAHARTYPNDGLHSVIGRRRISRFLKDLARPHVVGQDIPASRRPAASARADPTSLWALEH